MNYPKEVWLKAFVQESKPWRNKSVDLECSDIPLEGWQKYLRVDDPATPVTPPKHLKPYQGQPLYCPECGMVASQCDCWDSVNSLEKSTG